MKPTRRKDPLAPAIFREAARIVGQEEQKFACIALDNATKARGFIIEGNDWSAATQWFERLLMPPGDHSGASWYSDYSEDGNEGIPFGWTDRRNRNARVIGLLLAALLIEEGFHP